MSISTKVFSGLLETLYAASLDESQWQVFLSSLCDVTHSRIAFLVRNDQTMGRRFLASGGSAPPHGEEGYTTSDPVREAFMRKPRTGVIEVEDFLPHEQLVRSDYYPVMAAAGVSYGTCIVPCLSMRRYELIAMWRGGERPRLEPEQHELLAMLFPHIQTALKIHATLGIAEERARNAEAILDASATASLLLNASGRLLYMNEAAQRLAAAGDGFNEREGRIIPTHFARRTDFDKLVTAAARDWEHPGGAMTLPRGGGKCPLQLLVTPFRTEDSKPTSRVLVLATDPEQATRFPDTMLRQLYGLTGAETEIANGLLTGFSLEEIAALRGVSVITVRSQMKALFGKTGTRRQMDLLRLLSSLPKTPQPRVM